MLNLLMDGKSYFKMVVLFLLSGSFEPIEEKFCTATRLNVMKLVFVS